jgi:hypothetical protein
LPWLSEPVTVPGSVGETPDPGSTVGPDAAILTFVNAQYSSWPSAWLIVTRPAATSIANSPGRFGIALPVLGSTWKHWMSPTFQPAAGTACQM